jgi:hypothetical protein
MVLPISTHFPTFAGGEDGVLDATNLRDWLAHQTSSRGTLFFRLWAERALGLALFKMSFGNTG